MHFDRHCSVPQTPKYVGDLFYFREQTCPELASSAEVGHGLTWTAFFVMLLLLSDTVVWCVSDRGNIRLNYTDHMVHPLHPETCLT